MMTELSAQTGLCSIQGTTTTDWDAQAQLINGGAFTNWQSLNDPAGTQWEVKLYNQQPIEIQGLVAGEKHWDSSAIRIEAAELLTLQNPIMVGFSDSNLTENQLVFGLAREYTGLSNMFTDGNFGNDGRLSLSYENVMGTGTPVAQGRIWYTRMIYCWLNAAGGSATSSPPQFIDIPATRASLVGEVVKPKNTLDHFQVLANNEGIGSW